MIQQKQPSTSERYRRLPAVLRAYAGPADEYRVPDSGLGEALRFAAESFEVLLSVLQDVRAADIARKMDGGEMNPAEVRALIAGILGEG